MTARSTELSSTARTCGVAPTPPPPAPAAAPTTAPPTTLAIPASLSRNAIDQQFNTSPLPPPLPSSSVRLRQGPARRLYTRVPPGRGLLVAYLLRKGDGSDRPGDPSAVVRGADPRDLRYGRASEL